MVMAEIERAIADRRRAGYEPLYEQLAIYPFREGMGLRPAIVISACRAVGGRTDQAIVSADRAVAGERWNPLADADHYGKERAGDLWEGKRTVSTIRCRR